MGAAPAARHDDGVTPAPDPDSPSTARLLLALAVVLALVGSLAWLAVGLVGATSDDEPTPERDAVLLRAREYVNQAWNYGADDLDGDGKLTAYRERVTPLITTNFNTEFEKTVPVLDQLVAEEGFARTTKVEHLGVESIDADSAVVIVSGQITETQGKETHSPTPFIWRLDLAKVEGTWRVDDLGGYRGDR